MAMASSPFPQVILPTTASQLQRTVGCSDAATQTTKPPVFPSSASVSHPVLPTR